MAGSGVSGIGSASGGGDRFAAWPARPGGGRGRPCPKHTKETRLRMAEDVTPTPPSVLIPPHGDRLINLLVPPERATELRRRPPTLPSIQLGERSGCDLELLATGAFSPLDRFMGEVDYRRVVGEMRLANGRVFPIPVTLPVPGDAPVRLGEGVALRTPRNDLVAVLRIDEIYKWSLAEEAARVLGTTDTRHPLIAEMHGWGPMYVSGPIEVIALPKHYDFVELRRTPAEVRALL